MNPTSRREQLTIVEVATASGLTSGTIEEYRRLGRMPQPDGYLSRTPWWYKSTIDQWVSARAQYRHRKRPK